MPPPGPPGIKIGDIVNYVMGEDDGTRPSSNGVICPAIVIRVQEGGTTVDCVAFCDGTVHRPDSATIVWRNGVSYDDIGRGQGTFHRRTP